MPRRASPLVLVAITLTVAVFPMWDVMAPRADPLALRVTSALGLFAAASFLMHGVLRLGVDPLPYIDRLDHDWEEAPYVTVQMVGIHGFAQAAITTVCMWAVGLSFIGLRTRAIPLAPCILGLVPAFRILGFLGPLGILDSLPGELWFVFMISIPGVLIWCLILGTVLLRRSFGRSLANRPLPSTIEGATP